MSKKGFTGENTIDVTIKKQSDRPKDFVTVKITDKNGYDWEAKGEAGMVSIFLEGKAEVDFMGTAQEIEFLLATALLKVSELLSPQLVEKAILRYKERIEK